MDFTEQKRCFLHLLDTSYIKKFMKNDCCGVLCDRYHLVITFQYFIRAKFQENDYTVQNFLLALSISHDLYDESKYLKHIIMTHYLLASKGKATKKSFTWAKMLLFQRMKFKGLVDKNICRKLCQIIQHKGFYKHRKELHTGIIRVQDYCKRCKLPVKGEDKEPEDVPHGTEPKRFKRASSDGASEPFCSEGGSDCISDLSGSFVE
ncbi:speedy protein A-like [Anthonomus grandis grandis]|uniref:speedy protein A-like n=1 Tax=Anthonomus grandis grandis TaxID=2921223 RepID=UPI002164F232|nr:speedy protein A-like [Anthonomus grandis grandis]